MPDDDGPPEDHDPYEALRVRNFRLYATGWFVLLIGTRIQSVAIGWDIYERTGQALALGLVGLIQAVPAIGLAIPAGYVADRFRRRTVVICSLVGATVTSTALCLVAFHEAPVRLMFVMLLLDATALSIGRPARNALMPDSIRGRVSAINTVFISSSNELGGLESGLVAHWFGPVISVVSGGIGTILIVLLTAAGAPSIRRLESLRDAGVDEEH